LVIQHEADNAFTRMKPRPSIHDHLYAICITTINAILTSTPKSHLRTQPDYRQLKMRVRSRLWWTSFSSGS
jgi:hypothetical protein